MAYLWYKIIHLIHYDIFYMSNQLLFPHLFNYSLFCLPTFVGSFPSPTFTFVLFIFLNVHFELVYLLDVTVSIPILFLKKKCILLSNIW